MPNITNITPPRVAFFDNRTGDISREWYRFFYNLFYATGGTTQGAVPVDRGGTGTTQFPTDGQILVGDAVGQKYNATDLGTGPGIAKTIGPGSLSVENTGVLSNIAGDGIDVDQATGNVTITNTGVLSFSGGTTGLTPSVETTGDVVLDGILGVVNGGTGQSSYTDGQLLIGNSTGNTLNKATLTAGYGITITNGPGSITIEGTSGVSDQENQTATAGQTVFTLTTMTYVPGSNSLSVFIDGVNQQLGTAFTETNSTTVTFSSGLHVGAKVRFATA